VYKSGEQQFLKVGFNSFITAPSKVLTEGDLMVYVQEEDGKAAPVDIDWYGRIQPTFVQDQYIIIEVTPLGDLDGSEVSIHI